MKKAVKIILNILAWIVLVFALLVTLVVFSAEKNNGVSNIFGYMPMTVESDSMSPTFKKDDLIIVKEIDDVNSLKVDDVITFWTRIDGKRVKNTHRIVEISEENNTKSFITRGDNNAIDDDIPVSSGDIIGKWTKTRVSGFGKVMDFLRTKKGFFICIIIPMALFFLFELYKFIATLIDIKKGDTEELDEEEIKRRAIEEYLAEQNKKGGEAVSGNASTGTSESVTTGESTAETVEKSIDKTVETTTEKAETVSENISETVSEAAEKAEEAVSEVSEAVEETAEKTAETAAETISEVKETAEEKADEIVSDETDEK